MGTNNLSSTQAATLQLQNFLFVDISNSMLALLKGGNGEIRVMYISLGEIQEFKNMTSVNYINLANLLIHQTP